MPNYVVIFTRQDMIPEQQAVQTGHAVYKLGIAQGLEALKSSDDAETVLPSKTGVPYIARPNPDETHFTLIGVRNLEALDAVQAILDKFGYRYEVFNEPDIGGENTSIACYPIRGEDRGPLLAFNLLTMKK